MPELGIGLGISKGAAPKTKLLLDKYDIDAAFSLRKVRAEYSGPCVRVRNSAGNFADIGFTNQGALDVDALNAHCGDNDGTVQTWYNQSTEGGRFNAVQNTVAAQPVIYDASEGGYLGYIDTDATGGSNSAFTLENETPACPSILAVYQQTADSGSHNYLVSGSAQGITLRDSYNDTGVTWYEGDTTPYLAAYNDGVDYTKKYLLAGYAGGSTNFLTLNGYVTASDSDGSVDGILVNTIAGRGGADRFQGKLWEIFLSTSDLSANRISIENSILAENGLTVPEKTLLEKYREDGLAVSTRCLNREYVGPIVEVRGNSTEGVYLTSNGVVNEDRIAALCTGVDGFVRTWYDQSGGGNDVSNTDNASQPKIHDATDGVVLSNGLPSVQFSSTTGNLTGYTPANGDFSIYVVANCTDLTTSNGANHIYGTQNWTGASNGNWFLGVQATSDTEGDSRFFSTNMDPGSISSDVVRENEMYVSSVFVSSDGNSSIFGDSEAGTTGTGASVEWNSPVSPRIVSTSQSRGFKGKISELIIFEKDTSSVRTSVEDNINSHYLIYQEATASPASGFLADYSGAAAAYSVRQLGNANICMKVRRSSDDATKNIGFGADGFVDTTAISDFCGSGDGFVVTWYDQSGNAVDATQATAGSQPKIYDGTDGVVKYNGYPAVQSVGDTSSLTHASISMGPDIFHSVVAGPATNWGGAGHIFFRTNTIIRYDFDDDVNPFTFADGSVFNQQNLVSLSKAGSSLSVFKNGVSAPENPETVDSTDMVSKNSIMDSWNDGYLQENISWNKNLDSSRLDIELAVNDAFNIYPDADTTPESGFLSEFSGAAAAYSVRKLGDSPVCMRVRKTVSTVDYYQVIGFDSNGDLDTAAIEAFGGSADVFVQTWYDQSGNGKHATQDTNAAQPKIYDGTNGIEKENGIPTINFDGTNDYLEVDGYIVELSQNSASVFAVANGETPEATTDYLLSEGDVTSPYSSNFILGGAGSGGSGVVLWVNETTFGTITDGQHVIGFDYDGTNFQAHLDGSTAGSSGTATVNTETAGGGTHIGTRADGTTAFYDGNVQEIITYKSDKSSSRSDIENNINNYYLIHQSASTTPATGLLSEAPGAKVAFSTRQLGDALLCMKVVSEATGNPTKNIGFKNGELDTAAIEEFCGNNIGRVETWYDQSGNGNHLTPIEANRAWVDASGTAQTFGAVGSGDKPIVFMPDGSASVDDYRFSQGFVRIGGKPAIKFRNRLMATESLGDQLRAAFSVMKKEGQNSQFVYYLNPYAYLAVAGGSSAYHEGYNVQNGRGHLGGNGSPIDEETDSSSTFFGVTNDSTVINGKDVILSHKADEPTNASTSDYMLLGGRFTDAASINASQPIVAEFIGYTDSVDFDETRAIVETNMNSRHKIFKKFSTGLLDQYPGAVAAYSLRRLSSTYTGPLIRVVDTETGTPEYDIYANGEGDLEINQIYNSAGGRATDPDTSVSVVKWYDQSGNGNDVSIDVANAPEIKATTERVTRDGLRPAVDFTSSITYLRTSSTINVTGDQSFYFVGSLPDDGLNHWIWSANTGSNSNPGVKNQNSGKSFYWQDENNTLAYIGNVPEPNRFLMIATADTDLPGTNSFINGKDSVTDNQRIANIDNYVFTLGASPTASESWSGKMQEFVMYNEDITDSRKGVENNVNAYYEVYDQPLLDVVPDAAAAYSLRKLRAGYTGPAINVFNGTDYKDIYFKADGTLDTGAITRFCGSNDGTVAIWYDQSGNNNHADQSNTSLMPKVYDGTTGLVTENGKPIVDFYNESSNIHLDMNHSALYGQSNFNAYVASTTSDTSHLMFFGSNDDYAFVADDGSTVTVKFQDFGSASLRVNGVLQTLDASVTRDDIHTYLDGATIKLERGSTAAWTTFQAFNYNGAAPNNFAYTGKVHEMVFYNTDTSSSDVVIESNMNHYYSIY